MKIVGKSIVIAGIGVASLAALTIPAVATPGGGFTGTPQVRGTLSGRVRVNADQIRLQTGGDVDVVAQTITYGAGGFSGWHTHPGFVLGVVESGALTLQVGCSSHTYQAGQSFYESGTQPIMARNFGIDPAIIRATYVVPKGVAVRRDVALADAPRCDSENDRDSGE